MSKLHRSFWALTVAYGMAFMLPILLSEGTFLDGEIYAVLARNLASGLGSFWAPHYSIASHVSWFEHPPLGLNIEGLFFRLLGDGVWVEHVHTLVITLITGWLIVVLWRQIVGAQPALRSLSWLPVLLWLMNPQVTWAGANNMLENTMSIFVLAAVILLLHSCQNGKYWPLELALGAAAIVAAVLTKGSVGFFTLATLAACQLGTGRLGWWSTVWRSLLVLAIVASILALVLIFPAARFNISRYLDTQFLPSLGGSRGDLGIHFVLLVKLFNALAPALGLTLLILLVGWRLRMLRRISAGLPGWTAVMLLLAIVGSVPLVVSPRQSMFYVLPSFPFYALALAIPISAVTTAMVETLRERTRLRRVWQYGAAVVLVVVVGFSLTKIGTYNRSETLVRDVKTIGSFLQSELALEPEQEYAVGVCSGLQKDWGLEVNLLRYCWIGVDWTDTPQRFVVGIDGCADRMGSDYHRVPLATQQYHLYEQSWGE